MQLLDLLEGLQIAILLQEGIHVIELLWLYIVEQGPQFFRVILHRRSSQEKNSFAWMVF